MFQSTHPHGVRLLVLRERASARKVSIHAPTWGATKARSTYVIRLIVSIHAPTWGATFLISSARHRFQFQSTHPHGVRQSGHTHVWSYKSFNPRTHMGCDSAVARLSCRMMTFQSTHPHGVRPTKVLQAFVLGEFQSTHPHGVRQTMMLITDTSITMFQSTHPHGVRLLPACFA